MERDPFLPQNPRFMEQFYFGNKYVSVVYKISKDETYPFYGNLGHMEIQK
jgi:hypothetical protein